MSVCEIQASVSVGQICFVDVIIVDVPTEDPDLVEELLDLWGPWGVLCQAAGGCWAAMAAVLGVEAAQPRCVGRLSQPG